MATMQNQNSFPNSVFSWGFGPHLTGGNVYWVDSTSTNKSDDEKSGRNPRRPFATIDYAVGRCDASKGDFIVVQRGHAETLTAAGGIALDVAGITLVGLGAGPQRPTISLGTVTTTTITVSAANISVYNMRFVSTFADVVTCFNLTAAGFTCEDCLFGDSAVDLNLLSAIKATSTTDGNANNIRLKRNSFLSQDAATLGFVIFAADVLGAVIEDNVIVSEGTGLATIFTCLTGKDIRMLSCQRNQLSSKATANALAYSNDTASPNNSGIIANNYIGHADVTGQMSLGVVGGCRMFNNLTVSTDALSGFVIPAIDVDL